MDRVFRLIVLLDNTQDLIDLDVVHDVHTTPDPADFDSVNLLAFAQSEMQARSVMALISTSAVYLVNLCQISCDDLDARAHAVSVCLEPLKANLNPVILIYRIISEDGGFPPRIEDDNVDVAVVVEVVETRSATAEVHL